MASYKFSMASVITLSGVTDKDTLLQGRRDQQQDVQGEREMVKERKRERERERER